jgi:hypothetical protein
MLLAKYLKAILTSLPLFHFVPRPDKSILLSAADMKVLKAALTVVALNASAFVFCLIPAEAAGQRKVYLFDSALDPGRVSDFVCAHVKPYVFLVIDTG